MKSMINVGKFLVTVKKHRNSYITFFRLSNPNLTQWMIDNGITSAKGLHTYYADRILNIMRNISATPIVWQDVWDEKVEVRLSSS
jgi:hypothetical protein